MIPGQGNALDLLILAYVAGGVLAGVAAGFARLAGSLVGTAAGYAAGVLAARPLATWAALRWPALAEADRLAAERLADLPPLLPLPAWTVPAGPPGPVTLAAAFLVAFSATRLVVAPLVGAALAAATLGGGSPVDRLLGAVLGGLQSAALAGVAVALLAAAAGVPGLQVLQEWIRDSRLASWLLTLVLQVTARRA